MGEAEETGTYNYHGSHLRQILCDMIFPPLVGQQHLHLFGQSSTVSQLSTLMGDQSPFRPPFLLLNPPHLYTHVLRESRDYLKTHSSCGFVAHIRAFVVINPFWLVVHVFPWKLPTGMFGEDICYLDRKVVILIHSDWFNAD